MQSAGAAVLFIALPTLLRRVCGFRKCMDTGGMQIIIKVMIALRNKVGCLIAGRIMPAGSCLPVRMLRKNNAGDRCKYKTSDDAGDIADLKSPLFLIKETGKTQSTECQRVVQEHLRIV